jgi:hypothetical protein
LRVSVERSVPSRGAELGDTAPKETGGAVPATVENNGKEEVSGSDFGSAEPDKFRPGIAAAPSVNACVMDCVVASASSFRPEDASPFKRLNTEPWVTTSSCSERASSGMIVASPSKISGCDSDCGAGACAKRRRVPPLSKVAPALFPVLSSFPSAADAAEDCSLDSDFAGARDGD